MSKLSLLLRAVVQEESATIPEDTLGRCVVQSARADTLGVAFTAGYQAAAHRLLPSVPADHMLCLSASEERGAHPRHIQTRLQPDGEGYVLVGRKSFATLASAASSLLVLCSAGEEEAGRKLLRLIRVPVPSPGLRMEPRPELPFCPEIAHAGVIFEGVPVSAADVLAGDGWTDYVRPFRSLEDLFVGLATTAALLGIFVRKGEREPLVPPLLSLFCSFVNLAACEPLELQEPGPLLALDGALSTLRGGLPELVTRLGVLDPRLGAVWERDIPLLSVASRAREARAALAWTAALRSAG